MKETLTTITKKGQVTIPVEIRRSLGLTPGDKIGFVLEDDQLRVVRPGSVVVRTAGIFKGNESPLTAEDLREVAERAIAEDVVERTGK